MIIPDNRLFCRLDGLTVSAREQQRILAMTELGLLESENIPVFEEATQTAAHFLDVPICILSLLDQERQWFKSAVGLSRLGLMNELATCRQFPRSESFCTHVVDSRQILVINDTLLNPIFATSSLVYQYGIRAYLGVPLITSSGLCLGTLVAMDLKPRQFNDKEVEFLELTARWSMSEYERQFIVKNQSALPVIPTTSATNFSIANQLKVELLGQLTQELRTPLTSVMGMASVLIREIYGPLTTKQKEYLNIVHNSGQYLLSLVNEILELSSLKDNNQRLNLTSVDIEMLCQQVINTLEQAAQRREQQIRLSVEPGQRIWVMDKDKVRQILYHLVFNVIQTCNAGSIIRLHVSHRERNLNIAVWVSHPWLGEGFSPIGFYIHPTLSSTDSLPVDINSDYGMEQEAKRTTEHLLGAGIAEASKETILTSVKQPSDDRPPTEEEVEISAHRNLGLLLSRQLAEMHGGRILVQGTEESGYRFVISLPQAPLVGENF